MGNAVSRRRHRVDDRYTRPQGLYEHINLDHRKLRRLINNHQLAPCFPGVEEPSIDLDECPICFLSYPSLNRSKCCTKRICTECYLQVKSSHSAGPSKCPFCKAPSYFVEYRGAKTLEEKGMEQLEEQKVIEAKIRIRQKELYDDAGPTLRQEEYRQDGEYEGTFTFPSPPVPTVQSLDYVVEGRTRSDPGRETLVHDQGHGYSDHSLHRDSDFDFEDLLLMEAIWRSIQEQEQSHHQPILGLEERPGRDFNSTGNTTGHRSTRPVSIGATWTGAHVGQIAAVTENQNNTNMASNQGSSSNVIDEMFDTNHSYEHRPNNTVMSQVDGVSLVPMNSSAYARRELSSIQDNVRGRDQPQNFHGELRAVEGPRDGKTRTSGDRPLMMPSVSRNNQETISEWMQVNSSEMAVAETSFVNSVFSASDLQSEAPSNYHHVPEGRDTYIVPESFEDQIKLALALSLADAQSNVEQRG